MNCKYCQQEFNKSSESSEFHVYDCYRCRAMFYNEKNGTHYSEYLQLTVGDNVYNIRKCYFSNSTELYKNGYGDAHMITSLPFIAGDITPTNIASKIKTILTFL